MRKLIATLLMAAVLPWPAHAANSPTGFDLTGVKVADALQLIFGDALHTPYMFDPEVAADQRIISFRWQSDKGDLRPFLISFLDSLGYALENRAGVDFVARKTHRAPASEVFVYRPKFREVGFLTEILAPLFGNGFTANRTVKASDSAKIPQGQTPPPNSAAALVDRASDLLVFTGTPDEIGRLKQALSQVDVAFGEVMARGVVYEVSTSEKEGSAFGLLASLLDGRFSIGIGAITKANSFIQFKAANLEGIYSLLNQDSRFKVLSSPSLRIRSGAQGVFSVGQDVPVLGAVSYPSSGQAVQSVEYRSSGVIFNIQPTVREGVIDLNIDQQLSNFIATTTGVNNSPTLTKRSLKTSISMKDGDLIVLGGLAENKDSNSRDGLTFLPKFLHTSGSEAARSEILLVLQVQRL
ncbi:bacteriophage-related lipoprotein [Uliginosibacterium flavum]|uniref:Type II/III secretion system secretin-like domain-containing protein n=1 Tax=Uliginosibacterium flavum TaxID=1396831 RepID=A0ABV2TK29_9RHOO